MMNMESARELVESLCTERGRVAELLVKRGRSRRSELGVQGAVSVVSVESGWAVRAGSGSGSFFACGTGRPRADSDWPVPDGAPLVLPEPQKIPPWSPGPAIEASLVIEAEAHGVIEGIERELSRQLPGARLLGAVLDDGSSESLLVSSRGIEATLRSRLAMLHLEAVLGSNAATRTRLEIAAPEARALEPKALARRLADCLTVRGGEAGPLRERGEMVLAPAVGARLLSALRPLWLGAGASARAAALSDRGDHLASTAVSIVDDPRLAGGGLAAAIDGEGVPTRRIGIVDKGRFVRPVIDWRSAEAHGRKAAGCVRRPSWRDRPRPGFSHLFIEPEPSISAAELVAGVTRGFYLLDAVGAPRVDVEADRFAIPVCGFALSRGQATGRVGRVWLRGGIGAFLRGVKSAARDLAFLPLDAMIGAPTLLVGGLEVRRDLD